MDPEHASTAGRLFFSQAEKNQKTQRRGEKLYGEDGRAAAERPNSLRSDTAAPRRRSSRSASPAFLRAPAIRTKFKEIREVRDFKELKDSKTPKDGATEFPDGGGATGCAIDR